MFSLRSREQALEALKELSDHGYLYVVRDSNSRFLSCYSLKPKKYTDTGWGYKDPEAPGVKMSYLVENIDIVEINGSNRSPVLIADLLTREAVPDGTNSETIETDPQD